MNNKCQKVTSLLQELEHELLQNKMEKQKLKDKRKGKKRTPEEMEFAAGSKKLKVKIGKELEERNKKWKEKKKFKEQKESIKKVRKVWCVMYSECLIRCVLSSPRCVPLHRSNSRAMPLRRFRSSCLDYADI
jgi:hypothetical protein